MHQTELESLFDISTDEEVDYFMGSLKEETRRYVERQYLDLNSD